MSQPERRMSACNAWFRAFPDRMQSLRPSSRMKPCAGWRHHMIGSELFSPPQLTPSRIRLAYGVAVAADALQMVLGPLGWVLADQIVDVIAGVATWRLLGFHPLLLPTFAVEFLPIIDMLP